MTPLTAALEKYGLDLSADHETLIWQYCQLLWEWNQKLNLTRHLDAETFVARDVLDAVQLAGLLRPKERVLDVGSGGGVPGLLLGIVRPDLQVTLCDSIGKKTQALEAMVRQLDLRQRVRSGRVQDVLPSGKWDTMTARAVGSLAKMIPWVTPHWNHVDRLLLIKGPRWVEERKEARHRGLMQNLELRKVHSYPMPGRDSESVILSLRPG